MGLTKNSMGKGMAASPLPKRTEKETVVALCGTPNVGKSTVFNALTGLHQHTGNWCGKTVAVASGRYIHDKKAYTLVDLPGCFSMSPQSAEEDVTRDFIQGAHADVIVVVADATNLERSIRFALEIGEIAPRMVFCVNLTDEARKKGICISLDTLECLLGMPVAETSMVDKKSYVRLAARIAECISLPPVHRLPAEHQDMYIQQAENIMRASVKINLSDPHRKDRVLDQYLAGTWGFLSMALLLLFIFWLTILGANAPSRYLGAFLFRLEPLFYQWLTRWDAIPNIVADILVTGVYRLVARVVSVMLPPMAIFFPLFTLLEDVGYLPRMAFVLDKCFQKCHACGKQALTMCMGFGCNAAGVVGARIMNSPRERLIAILTNSFVPCNGRFPTLILLISLFMIPNATGMLSSFWGALFLMLAVALGVLMTFLASWLLSKTALSGVSSFFVLEFPPYRKPQFGKVLLRSVLDRTAYVLARAVSVAAPAGLILWFLANVHIGNISLLSHFATFLEPVGKFLGMDGVIILSFILGFPANETVVPIMLMTYLSQGVLTEITDFAAIGQIFSTNGWTLLTAINVMLFSLFHWPCSTTLLTIYKETKSIKWTLIAFLLPTGFGMSLCLFTTILFRLFA